MVPEPYPPDPRISAEPVAAWPGSWEAGLAVSTVAVATGIAVLAGPNASESDITMLYVAAVTLAAFRVRLLAGLATAGLSALAFNFFFTEPRYTLYVDDSRYWLSLVLLGGVGAMVSALAARLRVQTALATRRAARTQAMHRFTQELSRCRSREDVARAAILHLQTQFGTQAGIWMPEGVRLAAVNGEPPQEAPDLQARGWVDAHGRTAGAGTTTFPQARWRYHPLGDPDHRRGVLGILPAEAMEHPEPRQALQAILAQVRELLERLELEARADDARLAVETERIRSTLLSSVSHDLRTPLATITGAATTLLDEQARLSADTRHQLVVRVSSEARRLERILDNVLRMTRLDAGGIAPSLEWELPDEIVSAALSRIAPIAGFRPVVARMPARPALALLDAASVEQLVVNYLENALAHAPGDHPIEVSVTEQHDDVVIEVADRGPGIPDGPPEQLFEKFARGTRSNGAGLGLAICQAIAAIHGGRVWARSRDGGGAVFGAAFPRGGPQGAAVPAFDDVLDQTEDP